MKKVRFFKKITKNQYNKTGPYVHVIDINDAIIWFQITLITFKWKEIHKLLQFCH
jgi:hypothetical protein